MPTKCIAQMPPPMLTAPAPAHAQRPRGVAAADMRAEIDSATKADRMAMAIDAATSRAS